MARISQSGLETVQSLYLTQVELIDCMAQGIDSPEKLKEAKQHLAEFTRLLNRADADYMGGEDVYASLQRMRERAAGRLDSVRVRRAGAAKNTAKKTAAKKGTVKKRKK